ncbi:aminotransferase class V-fold PLP-dependent enzyme [Cyanobium sp. LEGE 06113]|uniref:aminotransferase class V-fold PLP-dependent enzyme n=1 Tax=Cyanobium sp. LEGE 06113 TaxID=1297573 RepID=UPI00187E50D1|nr:aminotransferase class V-fold PLP-dependent enzyme [Cyanobium sp. LEGE 06113]MBE9152681.1 aminotransferase class V-fold PLP-dependent enzyme [Cyanobium sp. LEGE 06113]MBE9153114.1 aminotransferase class V-fold PLP-dependent enzyme [Cyanobium sp. LEGE 06113]
MTSGFRDQLPALANKTYFNYGGQGPLPTTSLEAMVAAWGQLQELGPFTGDVWPFVESTVAGLRRRLGRWLGVPPQRLAFTENVTSGCVLPLWGLPWQPGDVLLLSDCEHPGVVAACQELARRQQLTIERFKVADLRQDPAATDAAVLQRLENALGPRTRLVVLSHLLWNTGQVMPIAAVASRLDQHPQRPWLLVDAAQSLGSIPVAEAAHASDIYACTGHKWCCGPEGLGVVALSERLLAEAQPTLIGWRSLSHEGSATSGFHTDGRRFEVATSCIPLFAGLDRSLELLEAEGSPEQRLQRISLQARRLWESLAALPNLKTALQTPPPAGIVSFTLEGEQPGDVVRRLGEQSLWIRSLEEPACLRACTHVCTVEQDSDRLVAALRDR